MNTLLQRYFLLFTGISLSAIGIAYIADPNLLLQRYDLAVAGVSDDNMYRGAYGGLFVTMGIAISLGFKSPAFRQTATLITLLFMGGFAFGRIASIVAVGTPHEQIAGLLSFELIASAACLWFLLSRRSSQNLASA
ncbi:MAG: DUF4345 domain-containing protein [Pseudomonadota bacterium]